MSKFSKASLILTILIFIAVVSYLIYKYALGEASNHQALQNQYSKDYRGQSKKAQQATIPPQNKDSNTNQVANVVNSFSQKTEGDISIYYKNLTTNESLILNPDQEYYMASLYKIILALYLLDKVRNGKLALEEKVGTSSATLELAIEKIITESNSEYAIMLADQHGWLNIENEMEKKLGIEFSFAKDLAISVKNVGIIFEEIASPSKIPKSDSEYLLVLLGNQKLRSKLPKYLPSNIYSYNKTGEFEDYSHDAAIFYTPKANYILIFMSKTKNPSFTNEQMALMSKEIYESLNK